MSTAARERLLVQVIGDQRRLVRQLLQDEAGPRWAQLDLTIAQLRALLTIAGSGPLPVGRLGAALGIGKPAASLLVDALVRRELVVRSEDSDDRRRTLVRLSAGGQELLDELSQGRRERLLGWVRQLDDDELAALARGLRALVAVVCAEAMARSR